ncbi:MAG: hypothetical protein Q8Q24_02305 [bacterium]|nr:hypothetical protein [bacterium]
MDDQKETAEMNPNQKYLLATSEYAEAVLVIDNTVLADHSAEEVILLVGSTIAGLPNLADFDRGNAGFIGQRLRSFIPHMLDGRRSIREYLDLWKDRDAFQRRVDGILNSINPSISPVKLKPFEALLFDRNIPYAIGLVIDTEDMQKIVAKIGVREFSGLHVKVGGWGSLMFLSVPGKLSAQPREVLDKLVDTLSHENYHALTAMMGASGGKARLVESSKKSYEVLLNNQVVVTLDDIQEHMANVLRVAKGELVPEANININVYPLKGEKDTHLRSAFRAIAAQVLGPIEADIQKLQTSLDNPPPGWKLTPEELSKMKSRAGGLKDLILRRTNNFFEARGIALQGGNERLLFYASTFLALSDFYLLPKVMENLNQKYRRNKRVD